MFKTKRWKIRALTEALAVEGLALTASASRLASADAFELWLWLVWLLWTAKVTTPTVLDAKGANGGGCEGGG